MTQYLTREDEIRLIELAQSGDSSAESELMMRHKNFIWKFARRYNGLSGVDIEDCVQIASMGMIKAIRAFIPARGVVLLTFAFPVLLSEFSSQLRYSKVIKRPQKAASMCIKWLDGMGENGESIAGSIPAPEPEITEYERRENIEYGRRLMSTLQGRDHAIIKRRMNGETLREIGVTFGITTERVRQLEAKAFRKLRAEAGIMEGR
jgi:RNA polymerase sigma factor (sigma-70 family)